MSQEAQTTPDEISPYAPYYNSTIYLPLCPGFFLLTLGPVRPGQAVSRRRSRRDNQIFPVRVRFFPPSRARPAYSEDVQYPSLMALLSTGAALPRPTLRASRAAGRRADRHER